MYGQAGHQCFVVINLHISGGLRRADLSNVGAFGQRPDGDLYYIKITIIFF